MSNWNQLVLLLIVFIDNTQQAVGVLSACFDYNGDCLREDTVTIEHKYAVALCTSNEGNLLSVNSDEMDYKNRQGILLSNSINFPFWLDSHWSGGALRSGDMVFYGSGNPNNTGVWRWTEVPDEEDDGSCITLLSSGEITLTNCEEQYTVICASNYTIIDTSTTAPPTSSITTIATTLEVQTTSHPVSTTTMFTTIDKSTEDTTISTSPTTTNFITTSETTTRNTMMTTASPSTVTGQTTNLRETSQMTTGMTSSFQTTGYKSTEDTTKSTSPTTTNFITTSYTTTKNTMMTTASPSTDQTTNLRETSQMTTGMTSSYQTTVPQTSPVTTTVNKSHRTPTTTHPTTPVPRSTDTEESTEVSARTTKNTVMTSTSPTTEQMTIQTQPSSPGLWSLFVVKSIGGCLGEPDVKRTAVRSLLHCGTRCHEHGQSEMKGRRCVSFNFYRLKSGRYSCELNFRRFDSDTDTLTNHKDCYYYERG